MASPVVGPEHGMYGKIGVPFCTPLVILFWMAQFWFISEIFSLTPPILDYLELLLHFMSYWVWKVVTWASACLLFPVLQLFGSFLPLVVFKITIWCLNLLFIHWCVSFGGLCTCRKHGNVSESRAEHSQKYWRTPKVMMLLIGLHTRNALRYMDYRQTSRTQNAKPRARSGHIFLRLMICGAVQCNIIRPRPRNMIGIYTRPPLVVWRAPESVVLTICYPRFWWQRLLLSVAHPGLQVWLVRASSDPSLTQEQAQAATRLLQTAAFWALEVSTVSLPQAFRPSRAKRKPRCRL